MHTSNVNVVSLERLMLIFSFVLTEISLKEQNQSSKKEISTMLISSQKNDDNCLNPSNDFDGSV